MNNFLFSIFQLNRDESDKVPGYFVVSNAPINVEGDNLPSSREGTSPAEPYPEETLEEIATLLYQKVEQFSVSFAAAEGNRQSDYIELVISIHGFSNSKAASIKRFQEIHNYINRETEKLPPHLGNNLVYIGYRWPSEPITGANGNFFKDKLIPAFTALPLLPRSLFLIGIVAVILLLLPQTSPFFFHSLLGGMAWLTLVTFMTLFLSIFTLVLLRLSGYFRDAYRANHFGVPDLVEFIRQLDRAIVRQAITKDIARVKSSLAQLTTILTQKVTLHLPTANGIENICAMVVKDYCQDRTVELSKFVGLDREIATIAAKIIELETDTEFVAIRDGTISFLESKSRNYWQYRNRIKLSFIGHSMGGYLVTDVIRILSDVFDSRSIGTLGLTNKLPSSKIGRVFRLGRLVLIAPDIPINTILSGRSNFLQSALRRFEETYLFSSEGDLALRLASSFVNYFSFPARLRASGYRLGNLAIRDTEKYGIVNLDKVKKNPPHPFSLDCLFVDSFNLSQSLKEIQAKSYRNREDIREKVYRLFTYLDCTDYTDFGQKSRSKPYRLLTIARRRWEPQLIYYLRLILANIFGGKDTHGGYFEGEFCQSLMYNLAFFGCAGLIDSLTTQALNSPINQSKLNELESRINQCERQYLTMRQDAKPEVQQQLKRLAAELVELRKEQKILMRQSALSYLSKECKNKKIQMILSPERYAVDILGRDRKKVRWEILNSGNGE
ncbi:MAG TPA: hypothetical protein DEG17_23445 [Cyanobacteria bacterium UBA11149]|nr:hypothetical protein [Cyanobacteria bacterium UBA11367]HBE57069.1 hypothetical protein [Cyanobacteria bacterium UBA11366]HBK63452.1 hypothetical protein [Cyanobacteria bacterium UBA11166]HBR72134.1 hypothetical protein [Cyanobacteria bacterium UBA11159]HBS72647.1 hypothetical protein [Cyanobacteria bacterium UBA11153]HBW91737.1 hypothetical protein [Cyanobacteria bacterium UBA11149]HCA97896.1 hypothetical protein [Cyanobacteria bacterium UBA9226]